MTARGHNQPFCAPSVVVKNPIAGVHASVRQPFRIPSWHHLPKAIVVAPPHDGQVVALHFRRHPPPFSKSFEFQNGAQIGGQFPCVPAVGIGQKWIVLIRGEDAKVGAHEPLSLVRHDAPRIDLDRGRHQSPGVRNFLFGQIQHHDADGGGEVGKFSFNGDGTDPFVSYHLRNAQVRDVGHTPIVAEVNASIFISHHPLRPVLVVLDGGRIALGEALPLDPARHFVCGGVDREQGALRACHHDPIRHGNFKCGPVRIVVSPARNFVLAVHGQRQTRKPKAGTEPQKCWHREEHHVAKVGILCSFRNHPACFQRKASAPSDSRRDSASSEAKPYR